MKDGRDHHRIGKRAEKNGIGWECEHAASPNVAAHLREAHGRFGDRLEDGANLEHEADGDAGVDRVLPVPVSRFARCLALRQRGSCTSSGSATSAVLGEQTSHDDFAILLGPGVLLVAAVELIGHPLRKWSFVSLDGLPLLGVPAHVVRQSIGQGRREWLTPLEAFRCEAKRGSLEPSVTGGHGSMIAPGGPSTTSATKDSDLFLRNHTVWACDFLQTYEILVRASSTLR